MLRGAFLTYWLPAKNNGNYSAYGRKPAFQTSLGCHNKYLACCVQPRQSPCVVPMPVYCWASVVDAGPTINRHRDVSVRHRSRRRPNITPLNQADGQSAWNWWNCPLCHQAVNGSGVSGLFRIVPESAEWQVVRGVVRMRTTANNNLARATATPANPPLSVKLTCGEPKLIISRGGLAQLVEVTHIPSYYTLQYQLVWKIKYALWILRDE